MKRLAAYAGGLLLVLLPLCHCLAMSGGVSQQCQVRPSAELLSIQETAGGNPAVIYPQAGGGGAQEEGWVSIPSSSLTVFYQPEANLKRIEARLRYRSFTVTREFKELYTSPTYEISRRIANRLEAILLRVKTFLGMNPEMNLKIKIFHTHQQLKDEYYRLFRDYQDYESFYIHSLRTIYTSEQDIIDSIIAHEMGHAVIDHYFKVIPPDKVAELMAAYVDSHLEED
jgi:hypothetical protein